MAYLMRKSIKGIHDGIEFNQRQRNVLAWQIRYQRRLWKRRDSLLGALVLSAVYGTATQICRAQ